MAETDTERRGIILAGGTGTRLYPLTKGISKQLMPVYDKPMIYYPLTTLMLAGIRKILIITTPQDQSLFRGLLGTGSQWGINLSYAKQFSPNGLAEAFIIGQDHIESSPCALILGDNIFYAHQFSELLKRANSRIQGATIFGYRIADPSAYGVAEFNKDGKVISVEEKPNKPKSNYAITGLYLYDNNVCDLVREIRPSDRGELEITDLNKIYLERGELSLELMGRGSAWLDTGTHDNLLAAAHFVQTIERRQGLKIACPEEVAFRKGFISLDELEVQAKLFMKSGYGEYLMRILNDAQRDHNFV
ncbi:glucose-1-phosphate thymidylyltransferase RfbA [Microbulbifer sp. VAAC004]|uniref:glucose-1-phosphate thymidylyltransferase RfbA n=1 Tax=unclassified Microbulbifer TaxID=2619833 RepID=UPI00403B03EB